MTFGYTIYWRDELDESKPDDLVKLIHELVHVDQVRRNGGESASRANTAADTSRVAASSPRTSTTSRPTIATHSRQRRTTSIRSSTTTPVAPGRVPTTSRLTYHAAYRAEMSVESKPPAVLQLRLVVEADDFDAALAFYRDQLGLAEQAAFESGDDARVVILDAGRATLELCNPAQKDMIDAIEVGHPASPKIRVAFEVPDTAGTTTRLVDAGATLIGAPVETPWRSLNSRLDAPAGCRSHCSRSSNRSRSAPNTRASEPPTPAASKSPNRRKSRISSDLSPRGDEFPVTNP